MPPALSAATAFSRSPSVVQPLIEMTTGAVIDMPAAVFSAAVAL